MPRIVVHNHWGTYAGDTPAEVLRLVHAETVADGGTLSYEEWRAWNAKVWKKAAGADLPTGDAPEEAARFLMGLLKVGALYRGPSEGRQPPEAAIEPAALGAGPRRPQ